MIKSRRRAQQIEAVGGHEFELHILRYVLCSISLSCEGSSVESGPPE
jgi:hypothetical protein